MSTQESWTRKPAYEPAPPVDMNPWYRGTIRRQRTRDGCSVYLIESGSHYKIGISRNVPRRIRAISTSSPTRVVLVAVRQGGRELEQRMHAALSHLRRAGEWFDKHQDVLSVFKSGTR